jgi:hypothetical protein
MKRSLGFSLLELMIGMTVSAILIFVLCDTLYFSYRLSSKQAAIEHAESAAIAAKHILKEEVGVAGYMPCRSAWRRAEVISQFIEMGVFFSPEKLIHIEDDHLTLHRSSREQTSVLSYELDTITGVGDSRKFKPGRFVLLSDCQHAEINKVRSVSRIGNHFTLYLNAPLSFEYEMPMWIGSVISRDYFVKNTRRKNSEGEWISALYVEDERGRDHELIENIQSFSADKINDHKLELKLVVNSNEEDYPYDYFVRIFNV